MSSVEVFRVKIEPRAKSLHCLSESSFGFLPVEQVPCGKRFLCVTNSALEGLGSKFRVIGREEGKNSLC